MDGILSINLKFLNNGSFSIGHRERPAFQQSYFMVFRLFRCSIK